jgi:hypothetical protein
MANKKLKSIFKKSFTVLKFLLIFLLILIFIDKTYYYLMIVKYKNNKILKNYVDENNFEKIYDESFRYLDNHKVISKDDALSDFNYILKVIDEVYPDKYFYITSEQFEKNKETAYNRIENHEGNFLKTSEFIEILNDFFIHLRDGHTGLLGYDEYIYDNNPEILPLQIFIDYKQDAYIIQDLRKDKKEDLTGLKILSINKISINEIIQSMAERFNRFLMHFFYEDLSSYLNFSTYYYRLYGYKDKFELEIFDKKNNEKRIINIYPEKKDELKTYRKKLILPDSLGIL